MKAIFYNAGQHRLRAGWRIAIFFFGLSGIAAAIMFGIVALIGGRPGPGLGREILAIGTIAAVITLLIRPGRTLLDKRSVVSLGLRFDSLAVKDLAFGWLLSGALAGMFFVILWTTDMLEVSGMAWYRGAWLLPLLGYFALHLMVGYWEELFFRGYLYDNLKDGLGVVLAIIVSCVLYGIVHLTNPNASLLSTSITVIFGFMRLFGLLTTKQLWLSMGMHMGWNFFQGPVFGFAASGHETFHLIHHTTIGPSWLTGTNFGPEASLITLPLLALAIGIMYWWSKRHSDCRVGPEEMSLKLPAGAGDS